MREGVERSGGSVPRIGNCVLGFGGNLLALPLRLPSAIGAARDMHATLAGGVVDPALHKCGHRAGRSVAAVARPLAVEPELDVAITPCARDRPVVAQFARPGSGQLVAVPR